MRKSTVLSLVFVCLFPQFALAYVDPGIVPMLMQGLYILGSALMIFLFVNPFKYIKYRLTGRKEESKTDADSAKPAPEGQSLNS